MSDREIFKGQATVEELLDQNRKTGREFVIERGKITQIITKGMTIRYEDRGCGSVRLLRTRKGGRKKKVLL